MNGYKVCSNCKVSKPFEEYAKQRNQCKRCRLDFANVRRVTPEGRAKKRLQSIKHRHAMSAEEYFGMVERQENLCAVCGSMPGNKALAVDHDHATNKTRELLCTSCNFGLGWFKDNVNTMQKAIEYIRKHKLLDEQTPERDVIVEWASSKRPVKIMRRPLNRRRYGVR